jgi:type II secretory ATPase GspE/PulE/Tfp pilus assembly ATPase PilB-like protein
MDNKAQDTSVVSRKSIGELLLEEKLINQAQLDMAIELQHKTGEQLSDILLSQKMIKDEDLATVLSVHLNLPYIDLQRHKVQPEALRLVPESLARQRTLIPLDVLGDTLMIVMANPQDIQTIQDIQTRVKMKIEVALGIPTDIRRAIDLNYRSSAEIEAHVREFVPVAIEEARLTDELVARTPIAQTIDLIITQAVRDRASDIHIEPQKEKLRIRFRIDGTLYDMFSLPINAHIPLVSRIKILAEMNIAEQRRPQDGQLSITVGDRQIDIRVASLSTAYGERLSLRILDKALALFTMPELGLLPDSQEKFKAMTKSPYGLVLVGGPTGSGKTTTLYALINSFNRTERNIMTIEDPVEYHFQDINQTQVNIKAGVTFAGGLRAIMRHDPNIILVGEIRDKETASTSVQAALTGHLVLSSIHANDSVGVLFRLLDLGVEPYLIISTLVGISTQRMVRRICPHCRVTYKPTEKELAVYQEDPGGLPEVFYTRGTGCNLCANTGYQGRTGIFEVLPMSDTIRKLLLNNVNAVDIENQALKEGLITMRRDGIRKAKQGIIPLEEVLRSVFS